MPKYLEAFLPQSRLRHNAANDGLRTTQGSFAGSFFCDLEQAPTRRGLREYTVEWCRAGKPRGGVQPDGVAGSAGPRVRTARSGAGRTRPRSWAGMPNALKWGRGAWMCI